MGDKMITVVTEELGDVCMVYGLLGAKEKQYRVDYGSAALMVFSHSARIQAGLPATAEGIMTVKDIKLLKKKLIREFPKYQLDIHANRKVSGHISILHLEEARDTLRALKLMGALY